MSIAAAARAMLEAGSSAEQIVSMIERAEDIKREKSRASNAERQRRFRATKVGGDVMRDSVTVTDVTDVTRDSVTDHPPYKDNHACARVFPVGISNDIPQSNLKKQTKKDFPSNAKFEKFWQAWPHKVGKPAAEKSFAKVAGELDAILDGLQRYIRDKPPNRDWLNPATFLNQRRWEDSPAPSNVSLFTPSNAPRKVRVDRDSKQGKAWEAHMASLGKRIPWANSAWYFDSEWPPPDAPIPFTEAAE